MLSKRTANVFSIGLVILAREHKYINWLCEKKHENNVVPVWVFCRFHEMNLLLELKRMSYPPVRVECWEEFIRFDSFAKATRASWPNSAKVLSSKVLLDLLAVPVYGTNISRLFENVNSVNLNSYWELGGSLRSTINDLFSLKSNDLRITLMDKMNRNWKWNSIYFNRHLDWMWWKLLAFRNVFWIAVRKDRECGKRNNIMLMNWPATNYSALLSVFIDSFLRSAVKIYNLKLQIKDRCICCFPI